MSAPGWFRIVPAGDSVVTIEFENQIDPLINTRAVALAAFVEAAHLPGVRDIVPAYRSVAVYFDPVRIDYDALLRILEDAAEQPVPDVPARRCLVRIPVKYGGVDGPDLPAVAARSGLSPEQVVSIHSGTVYRVFMLGFVPGFAYLGSVDTRIAMPRLEVPRVRVPAGSVGIADRQTGIYPMETPGGWLLIGRTTVKPFDLDRDDPFLLKPGDAVRFEQVD